MSDSTDTLDQAGPDTEPASGAADPREHTVVWTEFQVADLAAAQDFYGAVFGWTFAPFGDDFVIASNASGAMVAGLEQRAGQAAGRHARVYLETSDLEAALARVTAAGGEVVQGRAVISEEFGWFAVVADPSGLTFGLSTSRPAQPPA